MKVNKKVLMIAVLLGLVTVFFLSYYINSITQETAAPQAQVAVANHTIPAHVKISADMVQLKTVSADSVHPEAATSLDEVVGTVTKTDIVKDEPILASRVVRDDSAGNLSYRIPENMRAITIPVSEISGVAGNIIVGDKIDILVSYEDESINPVPTTYTQFQSIEVLSLGSAKLSEEERKASLPGSITLLVSPAQAEMLAYATLKGNFHFTLRNPSDSNKKTLTYFNSSNFGSFRER